MSNNDILFSILDNLDLANITEVVFNANSFDIEELLDTDDKDYVIFHKGTNIIYSECCLRLDTAMCSRLKVWDEDTHVKPVYKDWFMTILYHG